MEGSNLELHISLPPTKWSTTSTHTVVSEQSLTGKLSGSWLLGCIQEVGGKEGGRGELSCPSFPTAQCWWTNPAMCDCTRVLFWEVIGAICSPLPQTHHCVHHPVLVGVFRWTYLELTASILWQMGL